VGSNSGKETARASIGPAASPALERVRELYAGQSWWQRRRTAGYHHRVCSAIEQTDEQARRERQTLLTALLSGYELTQQRLARTMAAVNVVRIPRSADSSIQRSWWSLRSWTPRAGRSGRRGDSSGLHMDRRPVAPRRSAGDPPDSESSSSKFKSSRFQVQRGICFGRAGFSTFELLNSWTLN